MKETYAIQVLLRHVTHLTAHISQPKSHRRLLTPDPWPHTNSAKHCRPGSPSYGNELVLSRHTKAANDNRHYINYAAREKDALKRLTRQIAVMINTCTGNCAKYCFNYFKWKCANKLSDVENKNNQKEKIKSIITTFGLSRKYVSKGKQVCDSTRNTTHLNFNILILRFPCKVSRTVVEVVLYSQYISDVNFMYWCFHSAASRKHSL